VTIPENDILLVEKFDLRFYIAQKEGQGKPWKMVEENLDSLEEAIGKAQSLDTWEAGVLTEGFLYWSSKAPSVFNSTVIERGKATFRKLASFEIRWTAFLRVNSEKKAKKVLHRINEAIGSQIEVIECGKYWKDQSLFKAYFRIGLVCSEIADAVFETLQICRNLASHWTVSTPSEYKDERWEFNGFTHEVSLTSVESMDFHLSNFEMEWSGGNV
jgi:hypothetical protein